MVNLLKALWSGSSDSTREMHESVDLDQVPMAVVVQEGDAQGHENSAMPQVKVSLQSNGDAGSKKRAKCLIEVAPGLAKSAVRKPVHLCCVVDVSGSMSTDASVQIEKGKAETTGLSVLDVVRHALNSILATLTADDKLSIVVFSNQARIECESLVCDQKGHDRAKRIIDGLEVEGMTNLYDGLNKGMEIFRKNKDPHHVKNLFLFTDGLPNHNPPRGIIQTLKSDIDQKGLPCEINTFGFGYSLETDTLVDIAKLGAGTFSFIPDAGMVGTVFIHALARCGGSAAGQHAALNLRPLNGAKVLPSALQEVYPHNDTSWGLSAKIGALPCDRARYFVVELDLSLLVPGKPCLEASISFQTVDGPAQVFATADANASTSLELDHDRTAWVEARYALITSVLDCLKGSPSDQEMVGSIQTSIQTVGSLENGVRDAQVKLAIGGIKQDLMGQILEAAGNRGYFQKWGYHYLSALCFAHAQETCTNFKDPGVQFYSSGALFETLRNIAESKFMSLPPPKPSNRVRNASGVCTAARRMSAGQMTRTYYNHNNYCFAGTCLVKMEDSTFRTVNTLGKGDRVWVPSCNTGASILCVVKTVFSKGQAPMVALPGGLVVTPYHPIRTDEFGWVFPEQLSQAKMTSIDAVYNFVLSNGHTIEVNGVESVILGHELTGKVVGHDYFGSRKVVNDLQNNFPDGWLKGMIEVQENALKRDQASGLLVGLHSQGSDFAFASL
jgi:hypothetical protein